MATNNDQRLKTLEARSKTVDVELGVLPEMVNCAAEGRVYHKEDDSCVTAKAAHCFRIGTNANTVREALFVQRAQTRASQHLARSASCLLGELLPGHRSFCRRDTEGLRCTRACACLAERVRVVTDANSVRHWGHAPSCKSGDGQDCKGWGTCVSLRHVHHTHRTRGQSSALRPRCMHACIRARDDDGTHA